MIMILTLDMMEYDGQALLHSCYGKEGGTIKNKCGRTVIMKAVPTILTEDRQKVEIQGDTNKHFLSLGRICSSFLRFSF